MVLTSDDITRPAKCIRTHYLTEEQEKCFNKINVMAQVKNCMDTSYDYGRMKSQVASFNIAGKAGIVFG